jgi:ABC-type phosphate transport system auxiliary subunit
MSQAPNASSNFTGNFAGLARGPRVLPGVYIAKLWVDGKEIMTKSVVVEEDPRIQLSPADTRARLDFFLALNRLQKSGTEAQNRIGALRSQLTSLTDNLKKQDAKPEALLNAVNEVASQIVALQNRVMPQINRNPILSESAGPPDDAAQAMQSAVLPQLNRLFTTLDSYTEPISPKYRDQLQRRTAELNALIEQTNKLMTETVPNLNKQIEAAGLAPVKAGETLAPVQ